MMPLIGIAIFFAMVLMLALKPRQEVLTGKTMGTTYQIKYLVKGNIPNPEQIHQEVEGILQEVNRQMSTFIPTSEISQFNQLKSTKQEFKISADFAKVVKRAQELNSLTQGRLDITVGELVNLWSFGTTQRTDKAPSPQAIKDALQKSGISKLSLQSNGDNFYLTKANPDLQVDLSAIAKGFGVDKVSQYLASLGIENYLVEIGGEIVARGHNFQGEKWQIGIESPNYDGSRHAQARVAISGKALATSGDYRNYFEENGKRFSHEIDPSTGYPVQHHLASISIIANDCMTADGLATGLFILGEERALQIAEANNLAIYLIIKQGDKFIIKYSSAFAPYLLNN